MTQVTSERYLLWSCVILFLLRRLDEVHARTRSGWVALGGQKHVSPRLVHHVPPAVGPQTHPGVDLDRKHGGKARNPQRGVQDPEVRVGGVLD